MNGEKEKIEIEVALRDGMSAGLKQIVKDLDAQTRKVRETAGVGGKSFKQLNEDISKIGKQTKGATVSFDLIGGALKSLTTGALAPIGIAAGVVAAGVAIGGVVRNFAATNQGFHNMATNANLSTDQFNQFSQALKRGGYSPEDAYKTVSEAFDAFNQMAIGGKGSEPYKALVKAGVDDKTLDEVLKFAKANDNYDAMLTLMRRYRVASLKEKHLIAAAFHTDIAHFDTLLENFDKYIPETTIDYEASASITEFMVGISDKIGNAFTDVGNVLDTALIGAFDALSLLLETVANPSWLGALKTAYEVFGITPAGWIPHYAISRAMEIYSGEKPQWIPKFGSGGVVYSPTTILAGEGGPEAVLPLAVWQQMGQRAARLTQLLQGGATNVWMGEPSPIPVLMNMLHSVLSNEIALFGAGRQAQVAVVNQFNMMNGTSVDVFAPRITNVGVGFGAYAAAKNILDEQRLELVERNNTTTLGDILGTLQRMENPLGAKKMALGGDVDRPTQAIVHAGEMVNGQLIGRDMAVTLPAGSSVRPAVMRGGSSRIASNSGSSPWYQRAYESFFEDPAFPGQVIEHSLSGTSHDTQPPSIWDTDPWPAINRMRENWGGASQRSNNWRLSPGAGSPSGIGSTRTRATNKIELEIDFGAMNLNAPKPTLGFKDTTLMQPPQGAVAGPQHSWVN